MAKRSNNRTRVAPPVGCVKIAEASVNSNVAQPVLCTGFVYDLQRQNLSVDTDRNTPPKYRFVQCLSFC